jgi:6-phosphogluconate dehydrogenase
MVGLGRTGANVVRRMTQGRHGCVVYDVHAAAVEKLQQDERR